MVQVSPSSFDNSEVLSQKSNENIVYDSVGVLHYIYLDQIHDYALKNDIVMSKADFEEYIEKNISLDGFNLAYMNSRIDVEFFKYSQLGYAHYMDNLKFQGKISEDVYSELMSVYSGLIQSKNKNQASNIIDQVILRVGSSNYSTSDKDLLLRICSVGHFSVDYWSTNYNTYDKANCPWGCKILVAIMDVGGAVVGAAGTAGSPVGAVVGAVAFSALGRCCFFSTCDWVNCQ